MGKWKPKDITGLRYGRLTAIKRTELIHENHAGYIWECKCDCGEKVYVPIACLNSQGVRSCGCLVREERQQRAILYNYRDRLYTIKELCEKFNISETKIKNRLSFGAELQDIIDTHRKNEVPIVYKNVKYDSIAQFCEHMSLNKEKARTMISENIDLDKIINEARLNLEIKYKENKYESIYKLANKLGVNYEILKNNMMKCTDVNNAVDRAIKGEAVQNINAYGKEYNTMRELCSKYGISVYTLKYYMTGLNMPLYMAIATILSKEQIQFHNRVYKSLVSLCNEYNVLTTNVLGRIALGWDLERAIMTPVISRKSKTNEIEFNGVKYNSMAEACRDHGINHSLIADAKVVVGTDNPLDAFIIYATFKTQVGGDKPNIMSRIPYVIINDRWYYTAIELCKDYGINMATYEKYRQCFNSVIDTIDYINNLEKTVYTDEDGIIKTKDIVNKYGITVEKAVKNGLVARNRVSVMKKQFMLENGKYSAESGKIWEELKDKYIKQNR